MNFQLSMVSHAYKRSNMLKHGYLTLQEIYISMHNVTC